MIALIYSKLFYSICICYFILNRIKTTSLRNALVSMVIICTFSNMSYGNTNSITEMLYSIFGMPSIISFIYCTLLLLHQFRYVDWFLSGKTKFYIFFITLIFYCSYLNILSSNVFYLGQLNTLLICLAISLIAAPINLYLAYLYLMSITIGVIFLNQSYNLFVLVFDPLVFFLLLAQPRHIVKASFLKVACKQGEIDLQI
ncbi:TPA: hypothetical protein JA361_01680 [Legionella pneumophila]|nr:hypothetical protein [Legionella pneumophila]HAT8182853.1 hypothetical protein [Legionella pneumophila]